MKAKDWIAFVLLGVIWGTSFLWIKIAVGEMSPFLLVSIRILIGILGLLIYVAFTRPKWPLDRRNWINLSILGIINNSIPYLLISWGEQYIDSAVAAILNSTVPLFTMVMAHYWLSDDRMNRQRIIALLVGFFGIVILVERDLGHSAGSSILGQGAVLLAAISYACSSVFARRLTTHHPPIIQALLPLFAADLLMWLVTPAVDPSLILPRSSLGWLAVIWLGLMGVSVAYLLFFYLLNSIGPTRTTLVTYIFPLIAVALGVIFLKENLDWNLIVGAVMIVGSIVLVNRKT